MKALLTYILLLAGIASAWPQTGRLDSLLYDILDDDKELMSLLNPPSSYFYLYGGIGGDSKSYYAGREIGEDMYNLNGNIYLFHSRGYFAGVSGSWYSQTDPGYSSTILTAGLSKPLYQKKNLFFRAAYSRYFYHYSDPDSTNPYTNNLAASLTLKNKWIGGRLSLNMLFGTDFGMNLRPEIFSRIPLVHFGKYNKIQLEPEVSLFFGSESVEYDVSGSSGGMQGSQPPSSTSYEDVYGLLNTRLAFPVCFYLGDFDLELGYALNIPVSQEESFQYPASSSFSFSLGYLLPLN